MPHIVLTNAPVMAGSVPDHIQFQGGVWEKQTVRELPKSESGEVTKEGLAMLFGGGEK